MKKYIYKTTLFLTPIVLLFAITEIFYITDQGDLLRLGFLFDNGKYRKENLTDRFNIMPIKYNNISEIDLDKKNKYSALVIGDSFSNRGEVGYNNYLAYQNNISVLNFDEKSDNHNNPIEVLANIMNGDFFDNIQVDFIILQSVERLFVSRAVNIDSLAILSLDSLKKKIKINSAKNLKDTPEKDLFSDRIFKVPYINLQYCFYDKPKDSKTYKVKTNEKLFSNKSSSLLFYFEDIEKVHINNDLAKINVLNETLNRLNTKLQQKGINLIVLPTPDKYDMYYNYISNKKDYPQPLFFDYFNSLEKSYLYVDSKRILTELSHNTKDVYYYDDTHWSPLAAERIGEEISRIIKSTESNRHQK